MEEGQDGIAEKYRSHHGEGTPSSCRDRSRPPRLAPRAAFWGTAFTGSSDTVTKQEQEQAVNNTCRSRCYSLGLHCCKLACIQIICCTIQRGRISRALKPWRRMLELGCVRCWVGYSSPEYVTAKRALFFSMMKPILHSSLNNKGVSLWSCRKGLGG